MATVLADDGLTAPRWRFAKERADELSAPYSAPPIPVIEIAESHGVEVVFADFAEHGERVAGFCSFESRKLFVNADDRVSRQTFTIAHELGHWILHRPFFERDPDLYSVLPRFQRAKKDPFEQEANHFAANLLVPERLLLPVKYAPAAKLADIFGVSREMMENRLKNV